jgi:hypothetical protein
VSDEADVDEGARGGLVAELVAGCTETFRGRIASEVTHGLGALQAPTLERLKSAIDSCVEIRGFRRGHASQRLGPGLSTILRDHLGRPYPPLAPAVLQAWVELKAPVLEEARLLVEQGGFPVHDPAPFSERANDATYDAVFDWMTERLAGRTEDERDDLLLAGYCVTQWGAPSAESGDDGLLEPFEALGPESTFWDGVDDFVERLRSLAAEKLEARAEVRRLAAARAGLKALAAALARLAADHADTLGYFETTLPAVPASPDPDGAKLERCTELSRELEEILSKAREVRASTPRTRQEDARRQAELGRCHVSLGRLIRELGAALGGGPPVAGAETPTSEPGEACEAFEDAEAQETDAPEEEMRPVAEVEPPGEETPAESLPPSDSDTKEDEAPSVAPAMAAPEAVPTAPPTPPPAELAPGPPVGGWTDEELCKQLAGAVRRGDLPPAGLVEELQLRWLTNGMNLRAWILAAWADRGESATGAPLVPEWLCGLAVHLSDDGAAGVALPQEAYVNQLLSEDWSDERHVRFLVGWLSVGLLGERVGKAMDVARVLPEGLGDDAFPPGDAAGEFLLEKVIGPARRGLRPLSRVGTSRSVLESRVKEALSDAEGRRQLSERQFKNLRIKRYWLGMSGPAGPMATLLEGVRRGAVGDVPDLEKFASKVEGHDEIVGNYRSAIDNRLENFLRALRSAIAAQEELRGLDQSVSDVVTPDELDRAASSIRATVGRLDLARCPSVAAFRLLAIRLGGLTATGGAR